LHLKIFVMHARAQPEGRGFTGAQDYDRFVAECMRSKGFPLQP